MRSFHKKNIFIEKKFGHRRLREQLLDEADAATDEFGRLHDDERCAKDIYHDNVDTIEFINKLTGCIPAGFPFPLDIYVEYYVTNNPIYTSSPISRLRQLLDSSKVEENRKVR